MKLMPEDLPDDPALLKQMLLEAQDAKEAYATHIVDLFFEIDDINLISRALNQ